MSSFKKTKPQKKYGLIKTPAESIFGGGAADDDEEDDVSASLAREAAAKRQRAEAEEAERLMNEDPSVYDYDGAYDEIQKARQVAQKQKSGEKKESRYIASLKARAEERKNERENVMERKIQREQEEEAHLYGDKEKFVTRAYKQKLIERKEQEELDRKRDEEAARHDVSHNKDLGSFYYNLVNKSVVEGKAVEKEDQGDSTNRGHLSPVEDEPGENSRGKRSTRASFDERARDPVTVQQRGQRAGRGPAPPAEGEAAPRAESKLERAMRLNQRRNDEASIAAARERYFKRSEEKQRRKAAVEAS
mmetsp:Transcript_3670/g.10973  ORF Transcript_3670/g.10973 Transcript_3670/m.10973 type:complete len:305 (+) Transcript_3670:63-977(+)